VPALVVSRSGLGTLNHTALTVDALRSRDVPVHGIVLNQYESDGVAEQTNPAVITQMTDCRVWTLPPIDTDAPTTVSSQVREELPTGVLP
jgi:dethiobiotin synthetase